MKTSSPTERRTAIHLLRSGRTPIEVAEELGRSPAWVYKWKKRFFENESWDDLYDRSRAPKHCPSRLPESVRQEIRQARSELESEAKEPGKLSYIGAPAIQARLRKKVQPLPSISSIERELRAAGMTRPYEPKQEPKIRYPHLHPTKPHQLIQVDIVTHFLPGGPCIACFNAIDVVSRYPAGQQYAQRRSIDAADFLIRVWQQIGISEYTQVDNESCFSGGFTHPGVIGKVVRLALSIGTELVFSPVRHPESNASVERFHQDYNKNIWDKFDLPNLEMVQLHSPTFFDAYRQSKHMATLEGRSPAQVHAEHPVLRLPVDFQVLEKKQPITAGKVHFMRRVNQSKQVSILNLKWDVPKAKADQGVWATLEFSKSGASLRIFDAAPDARKRHCLTKHPFPLKELIHLLGEDFQNPVRLDADWFGLAANLFRAVIKTRVSSWISTML